jgi:hypothetical protein
LYLAFTVLDLSVPDKLVVDAMPTDPRAAFQQAVCLLGLAVNRWRNAEGEGHGRPELAPTTPAESSLVGLAVALITELLLEANAP